jgi:hypothetical protein
VRFRSWWLVALMAGCLSLPACALASGRRRPGATKALVRQRFGVVNAAGWGPGDAVRAARLGISMDRIEMDPTDPPGYDDSLVSADARAGLRPLPVLNIYTSLAALDQQAFADWAVETAARYGPDGAFWRAHPGLRSWLAPTYFELLNEPWGPEDGPVPNPVAYAHLFAIATSLSRARRLPARWLLAGSVHYTDAHGTAADWDRELVAAVPSIASLADGVTVHPYGARSWRGDPDEGWSKLTAVHADFPHLPVWVTEVGYSSSQDPAGLPAGELEKARAVRWYVHQVAATPWIAALFIYGYRDANPDPANPEDNYGLISYDGTQALPGYDAYCIALTGLRRCRPPRRC